MFFLHEWKLRNKNKLENTSTDSLPFEPSKVKKKRLALLITQIVTLVIVAGVAIFAGWFVVGDLIIGKIDTFDPTKYNASNYEESQANIALWKTKALNELTATQIFVVAQAKIQDCSYYGIYTKGYNGEDKGIVNAPFGQKQDLYGYRYRDNLKGYFDYYSTGLATVVKKVEYTFGVDEFYCYEGKITNGVTNWTPFKTASGCAYRTGEEYIEMTGCNAQDPIDYIVSLKTVLTEKSNGMVNGYHSFTLTLDSSTSVLHYVKKMNYMSGFGYPKFSSIELRFEVDDDMNFQNIYINENYKVIGMDANSKYKMEFVYENVETR